MAIRNVPAFPLRSQGLTQVSYSAGVEASLTQLPGAINDFNDAATLAQLTTTTNSTTSVLIGTGAKTFTVSAGLGFVAGMTLRIANSSTNYMTGDVTSYTTTSLVMNITAIIGTGTFASWSISLSAVGASSAASVSYTAGGGISATNVQSAIQELDTEKSNLAGAVFTGNISIPDQAYDAITWDANFNAPTKNAIRDKIESGGTTVESIVLFGSAVALATNVIANITSISLTTGEWDVSGFIGITTAAATSVARIAVGASDTSVTIDVNASSQFLYQPSSVLNTPANGFLRLPFQSTRFVLGATTTIYLTTLTSFTLGTLSAYGRITAIKVR